MIRNVLVPLWVAGSYFSGIYFSVAAIAPNEVALIIALLGMILALLALLWLRHIEMDESGAPAGLLLTLPVTCLFAAALLQLARWLSG